MKTLNRSLPIWCLLLLTMPAHSQNKDAYMTEADRSLAHKMTVRANDWRNGAIVYQVFVDRFAPSANLEAKKSLYATPRTLHPWSEVPVGGHEDKQLGMWTHELAFWGGDLKSTRGKLDYIQGLGADVLYLNPIQSALSNHKYDALDWAEVAPEYGTRKDVVELAKSLHGKGMKLMLDGVFNHIGRNSPKFQSALRDPQSPFRDWFFFGPEYARGYRSWINSANLVEVKIESPLVQKALYSGTDSVVQKYLRDGVDGWRLDTAFELGPKYLGEITAAAHKAKPDSVVVGEAWNYPQGWVPAMDGIMNFYARRISLDMIAGKLPVRTANRLLERMVTDAGIESLLKSWLILDNHDTDRLESILPDEKERHMAQILQFTLPGCPVLYYGVEVGMEGKGDPGSRGPMRWDLVKDSNPELAWVKRLTNLRKTHRALRIGDYVALDCEKLLGFARHTERTMDSIVVLANPSEEAVTETVSFRDGRLMNGGVMKDLMDGSTKTVYSGMAEVHVPARTVRVYSYMDSKGYTPYKRVP